ncbi:cell wall hydrolase [Paenibacillus sp. NEAU-GSW1]|uniref:cell wall hydrolase n=1 Tax=Paenibacillus sp. NEAU-GSW1 TaxID=2682486 RepID=UPI0012E1B457|nr:cell wall hydrolase [Paenibacillus sp. NEAU-GSW1]MUT65710.1 LysM peptidoglycan-binding domain-containing protein [Paenibacillus sp. NEAU-GSW1]
MIRLGKPVSRLTLVIVMAMLLLCTVPMSIVSAAEAGAATGMKIKLDGDNVKMTDSARTLDGRLYVPLASLTKMFGADVSWDQDNEEATIHTNLNDTIVIGMGVPVVYFNEVRYKMDAVPFFTDGRIYVPLRQIAELLHATVYLDPEAEVVELETVKPAVTAEQYGLDEISKEYGVSKSELLKRNGLTGKDTIKAGTKLKVVIPSVYDSPAKPYTQAEFMLLAKITMVEAGYEPYEGQLAIANVILNRVKDERFPDTIRDVIYSGKQFPPAHNGLLDKSKPNASSLRAAKDALNGKNNVEGAVYFFNPDVSKGAFWSSLDVVATIGHHSFAK